MATKSEMDSTLLDDTVTFDSDPFPALLDARILRALADLSFTHPTLVQTQAIPLILQGKDVLAKARTGSGKTAAYGLPAVQRVLIAKEQETESKIRSLILVPTRELAQQVTTFLKNVTKYCEGLVNIVNVAGNSNATLTLSDTPDILISTPSKCLALLQANQIELSSLSLLIIDEADLILSYGHSADLQRLLDPAQGWIPKVGVQGVLMSATMTNDVESLKGWALRSPAILTLTEPTSLSLLTQYYTTTTEMDKFLLLYVLLKLKLVKGKALIFVNEVDRGYRLRLFLEQFGVKSCVLNKELPLNSRYHIVEEFNRGVYDYIIATDEVDLGDAEEEEEEAYERKIEEVESSEPKDEPMEEEEPAGSSKKAQKRKASDQPTTREKKKSRKQDKAYGVSRGIDFVAVACVINFDLPTTTSAYTHRVGRTARAGQSGLALSFVVPKSGISKDKNVLVESAKKDEKVFERIKKYAKEEMLSEIQEWDFGGRKSEVEGFRYRMEDALKAVTSKRVQEARRDEVRRELLNSEKLKAHFAANPLDFSYLRHDVAINPSRVQPHLKHVPQYLMPKIARAPLTAETPEGHVPFTNNRRGGRGGGRGSRGGHRGGRGGAKKVNPLKKF
ncbi:ATP-dependent DNA/RNA helicase [Naganishia albida]|nr:ATP-dependent DNA/RNA helicase [Naganishia albida]